MVITVSLLFALPAGVTVIIGQVLFSPFDSIIILSGVKPLVSKLMLSA